MSKHLLATAAGFLLLAAASASAGVFSPVPQSAKERSPFAFMPKAKEGNLSLKAMNQDGTMSPDIVQTGLYVKEFPTMGSVTSPDGKEWFYLIEPDGDKLVDSPYYTDWDFKEFVIKVYDEKVRLVGQARGQIKHPEGAKKCNAITVGMQLTKSFFNYTTNDIEVMMSFCFNPANDPSGAPHYGVKFTTQVYSLTPELPAEGEYSPCVFEAPGYYTSAVNTGTSVSENFLMAFFEDSTWDNEDTTKGRFVIYKKAEWGKPASEVTKFDLNLSLAYSDGYNEALPFVMTAKGSDVYVATALYEKAFTDQTNPDDPVQVEGNFYVITLYKATGSEYKEVSKTRIACEGPSGDFKYRSYALGNFSGENDITFDFGDGETPCYIITVVDTGVQDNSSAYYAVYDVNGNEIKRFGNGSDGFSRMYNISGYPTQYGFQMENKDGEYGLVLIDYPSLEEVGMLPSIFEYNDDLWLVNTVPDRTLVDGKMLYAAEVSPSGGDQENVDKYVGWFNADGSIHHIDCLDLGKPAKIISFIDGSVLNPYLFNTNKDYEYIVWVYRWKDASTAAGGTTLELDVVDSTGKIIATRMLPERNTYPRAYVANSATDPCIVLLYRAPYEGVEGEPYVTEFINLPLNKFAAGEGTAESPYIIRTFGDLDQVRNNLTSHFRLANSIDCGGALFRPIEGNFIGSVDGDGFAVRNLTINADNTGAGFFKTLGQRVDYSSEEPETPIITEVKDITFADVELTYSGNLYGVKNLGIIAGEAYNTNFTNVKVVDPVFNNSDISVKFGTFASTAENTNFTGCAVSDADIVAPRATGLGGFAGALRGCSVKSGFFSGTLSGGNTIGGIAGSAEITSSEISDTHVNADITGSYNVGGVIGNSATRSSVKTSIVEGEITGTNSVGGIMGALVAAEEADVAGYLAADKNIVAVSEFNVEGAEQAHRVIGYSSIDDGGGMVWIPDPDDPEAGEFVTVPASHETKIGDNYVVSDIAPVETPAEGVLLTEGTTKAMAEVSTEWLESIGYKFGTTNAAPWVASSTALPVLYFENGLGGSLIFANDELKGIEGATATATLLLEGIEASDVVFESADATVASVASTANGDGEVVLTIGMKKAGSTTIVAKAGAQRAVLYVTVAEMSAISNVAAGAEAALTYNGVAVEAEGCVIAIYGAQGQLVATGNGSVATTSLLPGVYVAKAVAADGSARTLKFAAK